MKLQSFQNSGFDFWLMFVDGKTMLVDLQPLIGAHVSEEDLSSARIDPDWGCLELLNGAIDTDPVTLYRYATDHFHS